jgi:hypothetical protein
MNNMVPQYKFDMDFAVLSLFFLLFCLSDPYLLLFFLNFIFFYNTMIDSMSDLPGEPLNF